MANGKILEPFIKSKEGGLSRAITDAASKYPCPVPYKGLYGYHTNIGVTWPAFLEGAKSCGYLPTAENFFAMPEDIWYCIFKKNYWDQCIGDHIESQAIANLIGDWVWGAGKYFPERDIQEILNTLHKDHLVLDGAFGPATIVALNAAADNKIFFGELVERHKQYLSDIVTASPSQEANWKGWINRINDLTEFSKSMF